MSTQKRVGRGRLSAIVNEPLSSAPTTGQQQQHDHTSSGGGAAASPEQIAVFEAQAAFLEQAKLVEGELEATIKAITEAKSK